MDAASRKIRYIFLGIAGALFVWFFIHDFNPSGVLTLTYTLCGPSPYISELSPHGRVLDIMHGEEFCTQKMVIDPVYVDVRLPQKYDRARMTVVYQTGDDAPLSFGVRTSLVEWAWDIKPAILQEPSMLTPQYDGWHAAIAEFNLLDVPLDRRRARFILSSPQLDAQGSEILIRELRFELHKPASGKEALHRWLASFL